MSREHIETGETAMNFIDFTGRKILITGASSGIGKQTALTLGELGADAVSYTHLTLPTILLV